MKALVATLLLFTLLGCQTKRPLTEPDVATAWADLTLRLTKTTPANSPTYASRCLGYAGLTMYESVVPGSPDHLSLDGQLNGLTGLPKPEPGQPYRYVLALNAGQAAILRNLYNQTSDANKARIDSLERLVYDQFAPAPDDPTARRSVAFGRAVAQRIFLWSKTDGGHRGYLRNFDKGLKHPVRLGCWKPPLYAQSFSHYPLHPHWGQNRTFLRADAQLAAPAMIPYDTLPTSPYYRQFLRVYEKTKTLTQAEKEAAIWWSDDPDETFTPPGHSYHLATIAVRKTQPPLIRCAETYARVGMAVADAFIDCWKWKYQFFSERPNTFVPEHIDPLWESFWPEPPFPAFPSGHAIQGAAAATVLTDLYGPHFAFTDSAHVGRKPDRLRNVEFKPRHFTSFWEVAEETAASRFYGGIHCPQDNEAGLAKGREIGQNINALRWTSSSKPLTAGR
jgi:hypothetical protein